MADFAPPPGPPPPKVPAGWRAQWNDQYNEWFYVNIYTKKSQWDKPTEPVYEHPNAGGAPDGPPPSYAGAGRSGPEKSAAYNSVVSGPGPSAGMGAGGGVGDDEAYARKLQAEEDARAGRTGATSRGAADSYYGGGQANTYPAQGNAYPAQGHAYPSQGGYPAQSGYPAQGAYSGQTSSPYGQQAAYAAPAPAQAQKGGFLSKLMGGRQSTQQQGYGGYQQQQYAQPARTSHGGLGAGALGLGGGLLGGMLIGDMIGDAGDGGGDGGDGGGGDYGGGDGGGGDFGGGGGDFGGGDGGGGM